MILFEVVRLMNESNKFIKLNQTWRRTANKMKKVTRSFAHSAVYALIPLFLLLNACSKKADPDPREQFVGSWRLSKLNGDASTTKSVITIKSNSTTIAMTIQDWGSTDLDARISSTGFDIDAYTFKNLTFSNGKKADVTWSNGVGKLKNEQLVLTWTITLKYTDGTKVSDVWEEIYNKQ
jgi:hypothetical protein